MHGQSFSYSQNVGASPAKNLAFTLSNQVRLNSVLIGTLLKALQALT